MDATINEPRISISSANGGTDGSDSHTDFPSSLGGNGGKVLVEKRRSCRSSIVICGIASLVFISLFLLPAQNANVTNVSGDHAVSTVSHYAHHNYTNHHDHDIMETVPVTIVCQLSGEMGNNLGKIGHCLTIKWWLESGAFYNSTHKFGYEGNIVLRHQDHSKWVKGAKDLQRCFPNTRRYDFSEANSDKFSEMSKMQEAMVGGDAYDGINAGGDKAKMASALQSFVSDVAGHHTVLPFSSRSNISLPFLYGNHIAHINALYDEYYDQLRQFFRFDPGCCRIKADPDESVFHFRNFQQEMPRRWNDLGFHEANAQQASKGLFGHLGEGDKIAIVTRFSGSTVQPFVDEFASRGLKVRVVDGQDGPADFCLLMSAQKEVVGSSISTYLLYAGFLGNATRVLAYKMASGRRHGDPNFNFTHFKGKFEFRAIS